MINVLIASYLGAVVAWVLQDHAGISFVVANTLAAPVTMGAWTLSSTSSDL